VRGAESNRPAGLLTGFPGNTPPELLDKIEVSKAIGKGQRSSARGKKLELKKKNSGSV